MKDNKFYVYKEVGELNLIDMLENPLPDGVLPAYQWPKSASECLDGDTRPMLRVFDIPQKDERLELILTLDEVESLDELKDLLRKKKTYSILSLFA